MNGEKIVRSTVKVLRELKHYGRDIAGENDQEGHDVWLTNGMTEILAVFCISDYDILRATLEWDVCMVESKWTTK